ncbi:kelch repeat-containing protein At3g27220-like isoform X1 [Vicia villosa]|uniref:kelch repeat-containing protein At3g27220-like isoform X1 n=1 Tax=Vicia villosa TaxID=3911 RepID=UPI00273CF3C0|nr:kelch repeat-containing protein At3g27220-like isoform X1 [Vicia villosa]
MVVFLNKNQQNSSSLSLCAVHLPPSMELGANGLIQNLFYAFSEYANLDNVHSLVDVFHFKSNKWVDIFDTLKEMAHSHLGVAIDGRYAPAIQLWRGRLHVMGGGKENRHTAALDLESNCKGWKSFGETMAD